MLKHLYLLFHFIRFMFFLLFCYFVLFPFLCLFTVFVICGTLYKCSFLIFFFNFLEENVSVMQAFHRLEYDVIPFTMSTVLTPEGSLVNSVALCMLYHSETAQSSYYSFQVHFS